ncbi:MAG: hypothetical protein H7320_09155 [Ferruginibacter sp.]|nr:hypothetical protein [Ferruginibacter sp.]
MRQPVEHSFYYWKTSFAPDTAAKEFIKKHHVEHFYIRYMDVDWNYQQWMPIPRAEISGLENAAPFIEGKFTPVIFITNNTFKRIDKYWEDSLPAKVRNRILFINNKLKQTGEKAGIPTASDDPQEIQIDCDWTETTRDSYFKFLKKLKELMPDKIISVTIRLYPYKYRSKMGMPPVDKGLLMCYNMSNIQHTSTNNSVFDIADLEQYLTPTSPYPLPLDVALPVFGWYAWFNNGKFKGIISPNEHREVLADTSYFTTSGNIINVKKDIEIDNQYLREGDVLRMEFPTESALIKAGKLLRDKVLNIKRIAFYHYDNQLIKQYEPTIEKIYKMY